MKIIISKRTIKNVLIISISIFLIASLFLLLQKWESRMGSAGAGTSTDTKFGEDTVSYNGETYKPRKGTETFLLIGVDKYSGDIGTESYNNTQQADFLLLVVLDNDSGTYSTLQLNRDTMAEMTVLGVRGENAGTVTAQLALAHTYGSGGRDSCLNTADAVSALLCGVKIDHYIAVTMDAVAIVNDFVGGVTVEVLDDFSSVDASLTEGATVTLQGAQALTYVRARQGLDDSTNINRMARQRQYLNALAQKLRVCAEQNGDFELSVLSEISDYMESDCTAEQLSGFIDRFETYDGKETLTLEGESVKGKEYMEFYADDDLLKALVINLFYKPCP